MRNRKVHREKPRRAEAGLREKIETRRGRVEERYKRERWRSWEEEG